MPRIRRRSDRAVENKSAFGGEKNTEPEP